jgi:amidase
VPLIRSEPVRRIAFFTDNGIAKCSQAVRDAITDCARRLEQLGLLVEEKKPPMIELSYELELAILGADGGEGIDGYLREIGSDKVHPLLSSFVNRTRPFRATGAEFARRWAQWDTFQRSMLHFFDEYDAILSPVYAEVAIPHGESKQDREFAGFSYTMSWNVAGFPAATVRCGESGGLPIGVQVITKPWQDLRALEICALIEEHSGGWKPAPALDSLGEI